MNCRQIIRCYLTIVVALLFAPQPKAFAEFNPNLTCEAQLNKVFSTQNEPTKITVESSQILNVPDGIRIATQQQQVSYPEQLLVVQPPIKPNVGYPLKSFWQMRVSEADSNSLSAEYLISSDGKPGNPFNKVSATSSGIEQVKTCDDKTVVVKGNVVMVFTELSKFAQGNFNANVEVCVKAKDKGCYP